MTTSRTPVDAFTDKLGQEVVVGDRIVYGHAEGRSPSLRLGKVLKIEQLRKDYWPTDCNPGWAIKVQGVDDWYRDPSLCKKTGVLQFPDRIVKIDRFPPHIEVLFDTPATD